MDVLQRMKENHDVLRGVMSSCSSQLATRRPRNGKYPEAASEDLLPLAKHLFATLAVEEDFLAPEVEDRFPGAPIVLDILEANRRVSRRLAAEIWPRNGELNRTLEDLGAKVQALQDHVRKSVESVEQILMPKLRMHIPTAEREDLGQLFSDVMSEKFLEVPVFARPKTVPVPRPKRAAKVITLAKRKRA